MIEFCVLGTLGLRHDDGREVRSLLVRPKQMALLAYLALRQPRGWHQRNSLLAFFWPESDDRRARLSLRSALYGLRSELGGDVVLARGDDEVALNLDRFACDALAFEDALSAGRLEEALAEYRGPLLEGLIVPGLSELQIWLDERREGLRRQAVRAAVALIDRAESSGRVDEAVRWSRRAIELSPHDEALLRRELALLERSGDHAGALRAYEQWSARLRVELESEPSAKTTAIVERLRTASPALAHPAYVAAPPAAAPAPIAPAPAVAAEALPIPTPAPLSRHHRVRMAWKRWRWAAVSAGALATVALLVMLGLRETPPLSPAGGSGTVVLPFSFAGDAPRHGHLGDAASVLLSAALGTAGPLRSADPRAVATFVAKQRPGTSALELGARAGRQLGASHFIAGTVVEAQGRLRLEATLYEVGREGTPLARAAASGHADSLFAITDRLASDLLAARIGSVREGALGTRSMAALQAYVEGERELMAARYVTAADAYSRAVAADSGFARAYFRLSYAAAWGAHDQLSRTAAERAAALSAALSPEDRLLLDAWRAYLRTDIPTAVFLYEKFLVQNERHPEAWLQLAEVRYHWGPMLGIPTTEAADAFRRTLALLPNQGSALIHLARLEARDAPGGGGFDTLAAAARRLGPTASEELELRALAAVLSGRRADRDSVLREVAARGDGTRALILSAVLSAEDPTLAAELARGMTRVGASTRTRVQGYIHLAQLSAAHGRLGDAHRVVDSLSAIVPARAAELRAWLLLLPFATPNRGQLLAARDALAALPEQWAEIGPSARHATAAAVYPPRKLYLEAALSALAGDSARAESLAARLVGERVADEQDSAFAADYGRLVRAELALRAGNAAAAVALFPPPRTEPDLTYPDAMSFLGARERYLRAEALAAAGRPREALAWLETFPDPSPYDAWFLGPALARRAALHEALGERDAARRARERLAAMWRESDPELRGVVERGRGAGR